MGCKARSFASPAVDAIPVEVVNTCQIKAVPMVAQQEQLRKIPFFDVINTCRIKGIPNLETQRNYETVFQKILLFWLTSLKLWDLLVSVGGQNDK